MRLVQLIGHTNDEGPRQLARELVHRGYTVSNMPGPDDELLIVCLDHAGLDDETWRYIEDNPQAVIIPATFNPGPILPAKYADFITLNFDVNFDEALDRLISAVTKFVQDR